MSQTDAETPVIQLDYEEVTEKIVTDAKKHAKGLPRGTAFGIKKSYADPAHHYEAVAMYLTCKTRPLANLKYGYTLDGVHHFTTT